MYKIKWINLFRGGTRILFVICFTYIYILYYFIHTLLTYIYWHIHSYNEYTIPVWLLDRAPECNTHIYTFLSRRKKQNLKGASSCCSKHSLLGYRNTIVACLYNSVICVVLAYVWCKFKADRDHIVIGIRMKHTYIVYKYRAVIWIFVYEHSSPSIVIK